ncbi:hypothetical protein GIB67_004872 [Kingdonia uniflora]|uniref:RING-type domain-containing protein n=1 Tax=Kingdonia uniflora TaxID=39325 RepID=A0A7J7LNR3_9MAGN|nr:hypothetical protein GIB67_004872 [Kingdonia uniflora]
MFLDAFGEIEELEDSFTAIHGEFVFLDIGLVFYCCGQVRMGAACCVAARDRTLPDRISSEAMQRNMRYSPPWGCRWDNRRGRVSGEMWNSPDRYSHEITGNSLETKGRISIGYENISDGGSGLDKYITPTPKKSPSRGVSSSWIPTAGSESSGNNCIDEVKGSLHLPSVADLSASKYSFSVPSASSSSILKADPSASQSHLHSANMVPSRFSGRSPSHQFLRQVSDSRILGFRSPSNSTPERRQSLALSQGGSSDGWSRCTFSKLYSELVASSHREQWSFDTETSDSCRGKISGSNRSSLESPIIDMQTCGACSKALTEKCLLSTGKIVANSELSVVAVLICGHVYHAECLENMTSETDRYDPPCLVCTYGEKRVLKMFGKALGVKNRLSRNCIGDGNIDGEYVVFRESEGKSPKVGTSSSMKSSYARPFLRRHFSLGSKSTKLTFEDEFVKPPRRKGLWKTYSKA